MFVVHFTNHYYPIMSNKGEADVVGTIQRVVSRSTGIPVDVINSGDRKVKSSDARFISVHFARTIAQLKHMDNAALHRKASHVPIVHALKTVKERMSVDRKYKRRLEEIQKEIEAEIAAAGGHVAVQAEAASV